MITPDGTTTSQPVKSSDGYSHHDKDKAVKPPKKVDKDFKDVLDDEDSNKPPKGKAIKETAKKVGAEPHQSQNIMDMVSKKSNVKSKAGLGTPVNADKASVMTAANTSTIEGFPIETDVDPKTTVKGEVTAQPQSPFNVFKETSVAVKEAFSAPKSKSNVNTKFTDDQADLASLNVMANAQLPLAGMNVSSNLDASVDTTSRVDRAALAAQIQDIADKIVDAIYVNEQGNQSETIVTINNSPLFNDARIILTSFNLAPKEFNIAFENLRPDAKQLIDNNLGALKIALDTQGYVNVVHIISTSTNIEHVLPQDTPSGRGFRGSGDQKDERGGSGERRNPRQR